MVVPRSKLPRQGIEHRAQVVVVDWTDEDVSHAERFHELRALVRRLNRIEERLYAVSAYPLVEEAVVRAEESVLVDEGGVARGKQHGLLGHEDLRWIRRPPIDSED